MVPDNLLKAIVLNEERIGNLGKQIRVVVALPTPVECIFIRARAWREEPGTRTNITFEVASSSKNRMVLQW